MIKARKLNEKSLFFSAKGGLNRKLDSYELPERVRSKFVRVPDGEYPGATVAESLYTNLFNQKSFTHFGKPSWFELNDEEMAYESFPWLDKYRNRARNK